MTFRILSLLTALSATPLAAQAPAAPPLPAPVQASRDALRRHNDWTLEQQVSTSGLASTDANLPMSLGVPALAIGHGGESQGAHSLGEWYREGPASWRGPQWALLLTAELAGLPPGAGVR